jgi:serine/threonine protein kinase
MNGGKFIASGSYGCAFKDPVACVGDAGKRASYYKNTVGKVFEREEFAEEETDLVAFIKSVDPDHKWTVPLIRTCRVASFAASDEHERCSHITSKNALYAQLIFKDGGKDLHKIVKSNLHKSTNAKRDLFVKLFFAMGPVFGGLSDLNRRGRTHTDIKPANILFDGRKAYVIDFGLMMRYEDVYDKSNAALLAFDYPFYPPEFKWMAAAHRRRSHPSRTASAAFLVNYQYADPDPTESAIVRAQLGRFEDSMRKMLPNTTPSAMTKMFVSNGFLGKIDLYSLGFTLLLLYKDLVQEDTPTTLVIRSIVSGMTNANPFERCDWDWVKERYDSLSSTRNRSKHLFKI